jgi:hypothetical protein
VPITLEAIKGAKVKLQVIGYKEATQPVNPTYIFNVKDLEGQTAVIGCFQEKTLNELLATGVSDSDGRNYIFISQSLWNPKQRKKIWLDQVVSTKE